MTAAPVETTTAGAEPTTTGVIRLRRALGVWLFLCGSMVANGIVREAVLVPALKRTAADALRAADGRHRTVPVDALVAGAPGVRAAVCRGKAWSPHRALPHGATA
jgi:hypothetical protein